MKLKVLIIAGLVVLAALGYYLLFNWYTLFGTYLLPEYPGLKRVGNRAGVTLGIRLGFPRAARITWESPNAILFTDLNTNEFYRFSIADSRLERVYQDYIVHYFHLSPDQRYVAFTGSPIDWPFIERVYSQLWLSELGGTPVKIGNDVAKEFDFGNFGWTQDGNALIVDYVCEPKIVCIGYLKKDTGELIIVYKMDQGINWGYTEIAPGKIVFVPFNQENVIAILDVSQGKVDRIDFGGKDIGDLNYIASKKWVVGIDGGEIFFATTDFSCVKKPFSGLSSIENLDILETSAGLSLLLRDSDYYLYTLDVDETVQQKIFDPSSGCLAK
jgi:hypothetical protein